MKNLTVKAEANRIMPSIKVQRPQRESKVSLHDVSAIEVHGIKDEWPDMGCHSRKEFADMVMGNKVTVASGDVGAVFKFLGPENCYELGSNPPGSRSAVPWFDWKAYAAGRWESLVLRKGNSYGRICDVSKLCGDRHPAEWAKQTANAFDSVGIRAIAYPYSPGAIADGLLSTHVPSSSLLSQIPEHVLKHAHSGCKGGRMEARELGQFSNCFAYDYSSAYPFTASRLKTLKGAAWIESTDYKSQRKADYGIARVRVTVPDDCIWGPVPFRLRPPTGDAEDMIHLAFPSGEMEVDLFKPEIDLLADCGYKFEILQGSWAYCISSQQPFNELMYKLHDMRKFDKRTAKHLAVVCVGKWGNVNNGIIGDNWNPVYWGTVYSGVRARIYREVMKAGPEQVLCITIDGIICKRQLPNVGPVPFGEVPQLGALTEESRGSYFVLNDYLKDRPEGESRWRRAATTTGETARVTLPVRMRLQHLKQTMATYAYLGQQREVQATLPYGSFTRSMPDGVTISDLIYGSVSSGIMNINDTDIEKRSASNLAELQVDGEVGG